jgi:putative nucleotidyltransferase with HDIG domain
MLEQVPGSREEAMALLEEYTAGAGLRKHAMAVEAAMRAHARRLGQDEHAWGLVGLLHDFDYERWPDAANHPWRGAEILEAKGYPEWFRRAILSHASYTGVTRESDLEKALYACDELCGFLTACALVTPGKSLHELKVSSVRKRMKDKAFARSVHREEIVEGAAAVGMDLDEHIAFVLDAMRSIAADLGLGGKGPYSGPLAPRCLRRGRFEDGEPCTRKRSRSWAPARWVRRSSRVSSRRAIRRNSSVQPREPRRGRHVCRRTSGST